MSSDGGQETVTKPFFDEEVDYRVVEAIAEATDRQPEDVPALYNSVDLDALEAVVVGRGDEVSVTFEHSGCTVTVADGTITVEPE